MIAAAWELMQVAGADPIEVAKACEAVKAFADARQLTAIHEASLADPAFLDPTGRMVDPTAAEIATALHWTAFMATRRVELAHQVFEEVPGVHRAMAAGSFDSGKATEIAHAAVGLDDKQRPALADRACHYATTHTRGQLRAWLGRQIADLDPDLAARRRRKAGTRRRVWIQPEADGMATVGAYLTAEEAQACMAAIQADVANHEGSIDTARADQFVALLTGTAIGSPIPVTVIHLPTGPELAGHGPISSEHATALHKHATHINLTPTPAGSGYQPPPTLARFIRVRDRHCRFPGCRRPATMCDIDHVVPHPDGPTAEDNLACLCRYHHRLKTHTTWRVTVHPDHTLRWTSPAGRTYTTHPHDP